MWMIATKIHQKVKSSQYRNRKKYQDNINVDLKSGQDIYVQVIKEAFRR